MVKGISSVIGAILIAIISLSFISAVYFFLGGFSNSISTNLIFSTVSCSDAGFLVYIENTGTIPAQNVVVKKDGGASCLISLINAGEYGYCKIESAENTGTHNLTATENDKSISAEINCTSQGTATILTTTTTVNSVVQSRQSSAITSAVTTQNILQTTSTTQTSSTQTATTQTTASQTLTQTTTQTVSTTQIQTTTSAPAADTTPPTTSIACNGATCSSGIWYSSDITVSLSCSDAGSGCNPNTSPGYCFDQLGTCNVNKLYVGTFIISSEGVNYVRYNSTDNAGNMETMHVQPLDLDKTPPTSSILCNSAACSANTYPSAVTVSLSCSDALSGCASNNPSYCVDQSNTCTPSTPYSSTFSVSTPGSNYVRFRSTDEAGNVEITNYQVINILSTVWGYIEIQPSSPTMQDTVNFTAWKSSGGPSLSSIKIFVNNFQRKNCQQLPVMTCTYFGGPYNLGSTVDYYAIFTDQNFNTYQTPIQSFTIVN